MVLFQSVGYIASVFVTREIRLVPCFVLGEGEMSLVSNDDKLRPGQMSYHWKHTVQLDAILTQSPRHG
jgi:hypothetical protein